MNQPNRIRPPQPGSQPLTFRFDGRTYAGFHGDSLAAALLANDVQLVGRSFKYHRPRGIYSAGAEEPNALVQLEHGAHTEPNRRATEVELYPGLAASSQNRWPNLAFDLGVVNSWLSRLLPAGFYYKTFMWPASAWLFYEKFIRRMAGLGKSPALPDPDHYDKRYVHCDVLVAGGGPAGLQAACAAARGGARVILADENPQFGGSLIRQPPAPNGARIDSTAPADWLAARLQELASHPEVRLLARTTVTHYLQENFLVATERVNQHTAPAHNPAQPRERLWKIRARQVILATGAIERPLLFADNDRPGIMLAGAVATYLNRYGVRPGRRLLVLTNNDSAYASALAAHQAGVIVEIADLRSTQQGALPDAARSAGIRIHANTGIAAVDYRRGRLRGAELCQLDSSGSALSGSGWVYACDCIAVSGGWVPSVHLFAQSKGKLRYADHVHSFVPDTPGPTSRAACAGGANGTFGLADALREGEQAGQQAAKATGFAGAEAPLPAVEEPAAGLTRPLWIVPARHPIGQGPGKHFHELQNDATLGDIQLAMREGFDAVEHLKRYTTTGMATDQGKTANANALAALAQFGGAPEALNPTTYRPPYTPLTFGAIVGQERRDLFQQSRTTAMLPAQLERPLVHENVGDWLRPRYFPQGGESMHEAVQRESVATRTAAGVLDASTLGKIDLQGPDVAEFLNRVYSNRWDNLRPGRCRYGLMLNEQGMVFDDGVTTRLSENHYHMTTTTGGAARVLTWLEDLLQTEWMDLRVYCTSVTEQWAVASLSGPQSRAILGKLCDVPLDEDAFPFMSMQTFEVAGIPARVFRISFSGEVGFEINVPARFGVSLWRALEAAGNEHGLCPYGTETMHLLRAEKGFIIVGQDTDGLQTPLDLGMPRMIADKPDFIGKRSLSRSDTCRPGRKQLVGVLTEDPYCVLPEGGHLTAAPGQPPLRACGHITSSYFSSNLGRSIALALLEDGQNRHDQRLWAPLLRGGHQPVTITRPCFL